MRARARPMARLGALRVANIIRRWSLSYPEDYHAQGKERARNRPNIGFSWHMNEVRG